MTTVTTRNPVRSDLAADATAPTRPGRRTSSRWALSGVAAGLLGIGTMVSSSTINAVYDKAIVRDEDAILAKLADQSVQIVTFQVVASLTALALVVFAAGLHRRLAARLDDSIVPMVASAGRQGAVPRWMGITSLVLGGLTVVSGVLPVQYMAIVPGALWVLVISVGFLAGDKTHRSGN
jgi:hypothetical protein